MGQRINFRGIDEYTSYPHSMLSPSQRALNSHFLPQKTKFGTTNSLLGHRFDLDTELGTQLDIDTVISIFNDHKNRLTPVLEQIKRIDLKPE